MDINFSKETQIRVRYGETDQMGYCYYGNYAQYFEVGRVEALRTVGLSYKELEEQGIMLPVSEFNVKYLSPAFYDDLLTIKTTITKIKGARLVFVSKETMRPISPPENFLQIIGKHKV
jgi:acyl-CoA thioester hydrolase